VPEPVRTETARFAGSGPVKVLVAEDIETNQVLMKQLLERRGHRVTVVRDGSEAVQALAAEPYDVVLLDIQMPGMDGLEATRIIRDPGSRVLRHDVPIIAVTAHALSDDRARCLAAGMDDYLVKPVVPVQLYRVVEQYASSAAADPSVLVERLKERLAATYFGDRDLADSIVRTFLEESPRLLKNIQDAAAEDLQSLQLHAHSLKSAAATIGLDGLQAKASLLEQAARSGVRDDVPLLCRTIEEELNRFRVGK